MHALVDHGKFSGGERRGGCTVEWSGKFCGEHHFYLKDKCFELTSHVPAKSINHGKEQAALAIFKHQDRCQELKTATAEWSGQSAMFGLNRFDLVTGKLRTLIWSEPVEQTQFASFQFPSLSLFLTVVLVEHVSQHKFKLMDSRGIATECLFPFGASTKVCQMEVGRPCRLPSSNAPSLEQWQPVTKHCSGQHKHWMLAKTVPCTTPSLGWVFSKIVKSRNDQDDARSLARLFACWHRTLTSSQIDLVKMFVSLMEQA